MGFRIIKAAALASLLLLFLGVGRVSAADAIWQWSAPVNAERPNYGPSVAYLWIPPDCKQVRGILIAQNNMEEISILESPILRDALAKQGFAEVYVSPAFNLFFDFSKGAGESLNELLGKLATQSGYSELTTAPLVPIGHSAAASAPYYMAAWNPKRVLAAISVSGQWPYVRNSVAPDIWGTRTIDFVPALECSGEFEAAEGVANEGLKECQDHPLMPLSMLACPGEGHFAASEDKIRFLALYVTKAIQYRLPAGTSPGQVPTLKPIDPTKTGWLADRWHGISGKPSASPASVGRYKGDPKQAFWYFDEETAKAVVAYGAKHHGKKTQLVGIMQNGQMLPQAATHLQVTPKWLPEADGITFKLTGAFYDVVPEPAKARPSADWTKLPPGTPIGHAGADVPVTIEKVEGPFEKIGPDTFRLKLQPGIGSNPKQYSLVMAAKHPGDADYKPAVQQAELKLPVKNTRGDDQTIDFPVIPNQKVGAAPLKLSATASSGLPVSYYVEAGPAELNDSTLRLTDVPPRTKFPVKITIVAWQYGRAADPAVKTAASVEQTFLIEKSAPSAAAMR